MLFCFIPQIYKVKWNFANYSGLLSNILDIGCKYHHHGIKNYLIYGIAGMKKAP
jgi:hypothetical protein